MRSRKLLAMAGILVLAGNLMAGCAAGADSETTAAATAETSTGAAPQTQAQTPASSSSSAASSSSSAADTSELFSDRDLEQVADVSGASYIVLADGTDVTISGEGVYVVSGTARNSTIIVNAPEDAKVQLVLSGVSITNDDSPAIYVKEADKVFATTASGTENTLSVTGTFTADGTTNTDAVIFCRSDLTLNGEGTLTVTSAQGNGISGKDEVTVTGGTYAITAKEDAIEAHDAVNIADGTFTITTDKDGLHSEDSDDPTAGSIYIGGGPFTIDAGDDGIQGTTQTTIDGGTFTIQASEGIESTIVTIDGGTIDITASDDGINAAQKGTGTDIEIIINGGDITIDMGQGDTDALDSNGSLYINGGTLTITANSPFDYDKDGAINGGTVFVNGSQVTEIYNQMMGGGRGQMGGRGQAPGGGSQMPGGGVRPGNAGSV